MSNLKDIKDRITSIQNTQTITKAMKMVAAAKVKKAESRVKTARPFAKELAFVFSRLLRSVNKYSMSGLQVKRAIDNYAELLKPREIKTAGLLVVTSTKGLAGAYNANVIRYTLKRIEEYNKQNISVKLFIVGQKGYAGLRRKCESLNCEIEKKYLNLPQNPNSGQAIVIAEDMATCFVENKIDNIEIITTQFHNMMSYKVVDWKILPLNVDEVKENIETDEQKPNKGTQIDALMTFEPNKHVILQKVVPMFITNMIYHALLEATASELASRMTAMSSACQNAEDMIYKLSVDYNKARQGAITQEINEVVSGANAI